MRKRIFKNPKLFIALFFFLVLISGYVQAAERALEITYPQIPGDFTPKTVSSGLPEYVDYIFRFAVAIIGIIVLGVLIYNGFQYLTSVGKPEKLSDARQGIISALLGAVILFSAVLIFNTINPQLTILELSAPGLIDPVIKPGIYLCDYDAGDINSVIDEYMFGDKDTKIEAAKKLKKAIIKEENKKGTCIEIDSSSQKLKNFVFKPSEHTAFVIPRKENVYIPATETDAAKTDIEWIYDYGIVLHEKDNFRGRCKLAGLYDQKMAPHPNLVGFDSVRSVTFFQKPEIEPISDNLGVILYQCLNYNDATFCPSGLTGTLNSGSFPTSPPGNDLTLVTEKKLGKLTAPIKVAPTWGTRSIKIDPVGSYFAVLFSEDKFTGDICEVISRDDNNLLDRDIGRCGFGCNWATDLLTGTKGQLKYCNPCLKSMYVIKGQVIY